MSKDSSSIDCAAVVLAAGKGTRMRSELPKVATELLGKPLIVHVLENLYKAGIRRFCIVVGYRRDIVESIIPEFADAQIDFAIQEEQKGTAHAFLSARENLSSFKGSVLVASGDMPALRSSSFRNLVDEHQATGSQATVLSAHMEDPTGYGRLIRDQSGVLERIVEQKDGAGAELDVQEVNTGTYVFECPGVFEDLTRIGSDNAQAEYYLPDMISLYKKQGESVGSLQLDDAREAQGVNSPEELGVLSESIQRQAD